MSKGTVRLKQAVVVRSCTFEMTRWLIKWPLSLMMSVVLLIKSEGSMTDWTTALTDKGNQSVLIDSDGFMRRAAS